MKRNSPYIWIAISRMVSRAVLRTAVGLMAAAPVVQCFSGTVRAAFEIKPAGAVSAGLGGSAEANAAGAWSVLGNPAGLGWSDGIELASFYSRLYSLKELSYAGSAAGLRLPFGGAGLSYSQFGEAPYQEKEAAFALAFDLSPKVQIGGTARGYFLEIDDYGSARAAGFDVGAVSRLHPNARLSLLAKNVNRPALGPSRIPLPSGIMAGGAFHIAPGLQLYTEVHAVEPDPILVKSGLEFSLGDRLFLRGGLRTRAMQFAGGFGIQLGPVKVDYAYQHSSRLPGSHQLSLELSWDRDRQ